LACISIQFTNSKGYFAKREQSRNVYKKKHTHQAVIEREVQDGSRVG